MAHYHEYTFVSPENQQQWNSYHDIRKRILFESRGRIGAYNANHPDEHKQGNYPKLLLYQGTPIGVIRIDIEESCAIFRRVAIEEKDQRRGHGRILIALAETFSIASGCTEAVSHVASDAVNFYRKCGFSILGDDCRTEGRSVKMYKRLTANN